jgi:mycofactocin system creatininase family protein
VSLAALSWPSVTSGSLLVVPVGSCEQHGPHLPLDTDTRIAVALARALADRSDDVVVAPAIGIGASGEHESFPGTLSIGTLAMETVTVELIRSALPGEASGRPTPFDAVVIVNGHGGNIEALDRAGALATTEGREVLVWHPRVQGGDSHAGRTETSMMLHLDPSCVSMDVAEAGSTARWREIGPVVMSQGLAAVTPNGVLGDPTTATAEEGGRVFADLVSQLTADVERLRGRLGR